MAKQKKKVCSICKKPFTEYGNNAEPINSGRCCDSCDNLVVIPARLERMGYSKGHALLLGEHLLEFRKMEKGQ